MLGHLCTAMTTNKITLAISSSQGRQRLQVERTCRAPALKTKIRDLLKLEEDFKVQRDNGRGRPSKDQIRLSGTTTILGLGLQNGDVLHVFPLSGTRFQDEELKQQNGTSNSIGHNQNIQGSTTDLTNSPSSLNQG